MKEILHPKCMEHSVGTHGIVNYIGTYSIFNRSSQLQIKPILTLLSNRTTCSLNLSSVFLLRRHLDYNS